jgi:hypothetical protein
MPRKRFVTDFGKREALTISRIEGIQLLTKLCLNNRGSDKPQVAIMKSTCCIPHDVIRLMFAAAIHLVADKRNGNLRPSLPHNGHVGYSRFSHISGVVCSRLICL